MPSPPLVPVDRLLPARAGLGRDTPRQNAPRRCSHSTARPRASRRRPTTSKRSRRVAWDRAVVVAKPRERERAELVPLAVADRHDRPLGARWTRPPSGPSPPRRRAPRRPARSGRSRRAPKTSARCAPGCASRAAPGHRRPAPPRRAQVAGGPSTCRRPYAGNARPGRAHRQASVHGIRAHARVRSHGEVIRIRRKSRPLAGREPLSTLRLGAVPRRAEEPWRPLRTIATLATVVFLFAAPTAEAARSEFFGMAYGPALDNTDLQSMAGTGVKTVRFADQLESGAAEQGPLRLARARPADRRPRLAWDSPDPIHVGVPGVGRHRGARAPAGECPLAVRVGGLPEGGGEPVRARRDILDRRLSPAVRSGRRAAAGAVVAGLERAKPQ